MIQVISWWDLSAGASNPMHTSQYTFWLVQIHAPQPCELVPIYDRKEEAQTVYVTSVLFLC